MEINQFAGGTETVTEKGIQSSRNSIAESTEQGGLSAAVSWLKSIRLAKLLEEMERIDFRKENAMNELEELTRSVDELFRSNRGGEKGIHGFIGERAQVFLCNAWSIIKGEVRICELIDDNGMTDYFEHGISIQQKACRSNGWLGLDHVLKHSEKYPEFCGKYHIPKDFYEEFVRIGNMSQYEAGCLSRHEWNLWLEIQKVKQAGITVEPMKVTYSEIQRDRIYDTIENQRDMLHEEVEKQTKLAEDSHKPTVKACIQTTFISATIEGVLGGASVALEKRFMGKNFKDYNKQDLKDIEMAAVEGTVKGALRGTAVYLTENYTSIPGVVAGSAITVAFESVKAMKKCSDGVISKQECVRITKKSTLIATAGALGAKLGEEICPVPVVGGVVGGFVFSFFADRVYFLIINRMGAVKEDAVPQAA